MDGRVDDSARGDGYCTATEEGAGSNEEEMAGDEGARPEDHRERGARKGRAAGGVKHRGAALVGIFHDEGRKREHVI